MRITTEDVKNLTGKFIIQLNHPTEKSPNPHTTITKENWNFLKEKRISFICGREWLGFYYSHNKFETDEKFVDYFNNYYNNSKERYHRLLTSEELDFLLKKMKEENY